MIQKKILVYDTTRGFSRFVKYYFSDTHIVECYHYPNRLNVKSNEYEVAFVIVNGRSDIDNFVTISNNVKQVFLNSKLDYFELMHSRDISSQVLYLDLGLPKNDLVKHLKQHISSN